MDEYTLTGSRQLVDPKTGKSSKIPNIAKKLPEDLRLKIANFFRQMELLVFHQDILNNFDSYLNCVFTKAFNRRQHRSKRRKDAVAAGAGRRIARRKNVI